MTGKAAPEPPRDRLRTGRRPAASLADEYVLLVKALVGGTAVVLAAALAVVGAAALILA